MRVPMAARSPEPAKRWLFPQSARATEAGRCRISISSRISTAAFIRAPGRIKSVPLKARREDRKGEIDPHHEQDNRACEKHRELVAHGVVRGVDPGVPKPEADEHPRQQDQRRVDPGRNEGEGSQEIAAKKKKKIRHSHFLL